MVHAVARDRQLLPLHLFVCWSTLAAAALAVEGTPGRIDTSTMHGKVLCGYQGWFRCAGDRADMGWVHWSWDPKRVAPETLTFEMWPDMRECAPDEQYPVPGFTLPDGSPATLFSSDHPRTVLRHFEWMARYGIDGVWLQHFLVDLPEGPNASRHASRMRVLGEVRSAAAKTGRAWALAFDMAGMPPERILDALTAEWRRLVDAGITADDRYLHEGGKPVLMVWGFYPHQNVTPEIANRIIDFLKNDPKYGVFLVGGCEWEWRTEKEEGWPGFLRRFDAISPWNVGNYRLDKDKCQWASTAYWKEDKTEAERAGMLWLPVFYPGFQWDNLKRLAPGTSRIARNKGRFFWQQFVDAAQLGCDMAYIAMFDEVDEGTAIFKITDNPPPQAHFATLEGMPSDTYLHLAGEGTAMLLGRRERTAEPPLSR